MQFNEIKEAALASWDLKILPSITAAQWAIEGAYGTSGLARPPYNNHFGIKASSDWKGRTVNMRTQEYGPNGSYWINADFRAYDSMVDSFKDHAAFFSNNEWRKNNYRHVIGETDYIKAAQALQASGYATAGNYGTSIIRVIEQNKLYEWDKEAFARASSGGGSGTPSPGEKPEPLKPSTVSIQRHNTKSVGGELTTAGREEASKIKITVLGDESAVEAVPYLRKRVQTVNGTFNANKTLEAIVADIKALKSAKQLQTYVVVMAGRYGSVTKDSVDAIVDAVGEGHKILFVDTPANTPNKGAMTQEYTAVSNRHNSAYHVNWRKYATPYITYFYDDGITQNKNGSAALADYIAQACYEATSGTFEGRTAQWTNKAYYGIEQVEYNQDGFYSPKGQSVLYNPEANELWGFRSDGKTHWIDGLVEVSNEQNRGMLMNAALKYMKEHSVPAVQYTVHLSEMPQSVSIGDKGIFVDHYFNPPLAIQATIIEIVTSDTDPSSNTVTLGNVTELYPTENQDVIELKRQLQGLREETIKEYRKGEPVTIEVDSTNGLELSATNKETRIFVVAKQGSWIVDDVVYRWERLSDNKESDDTFNKGLAGSVQSGALTVTTGDLVNKAATFVVRAYDSKGELIASQNIHVTEPTKSKSAYEIAVDNGFRGTEAEWLKSLKGDPGERGIQGPPGSDGKIQYIHVAYADNTQGLNFSTTDSNRSYIGTYVDDKEADSAEWSKYKWTKAQGPKGDPGKETKHHQAFAKDTKGTGFSLTDKADLDYIGSYFDTEEASSTDWNRYTWTKKPETIERDQADTNKQTEESINAIRGEAQKQRQELEAKAAKNAVDALIKEIRVLQSAMADDKKASEAAVANALNRVALTHNELQDMAVRYSFLDRSITLADEGLIVGNKGAGTYLRVADDRISFVNNGSEVAFISGNMLQFTQAIFIERIQVGEWLLSGYEHDQQIFVIRHVGRR